VFPFPDYRLLRDSQLHLMPSGPASLMLTTVMGTRANAQFAKLLFVLPVLKAARYSGASVRQWLDGHSVGPEAEAVVRTLIRLSTYTADVEELFADAAIGQLQIGRWAAELAAAFARLRALPLRRVGGEHLRRRIETEPDHGGHVDRGGEPGPVGEEQRPNPTDARRRCSVVLLVGHVAVAQLPEPARHVREGERVGRRARSGVCA